MIPFLRYMSQDQSESKINLRENFQLSEFSVFNSEKKKDRTRNRLIGTTIRGGKRTSYRWVHDPSGGKSSPFPQPDAKTSRNRSPLRAVPVNREENRAKHGSTPSMFARARAHIHTHTHTRTCTGTYTNIRRN